MTDRKRRMIFAGVLALCLALVSALCFIQATTVEQLAMLNLYMENPSIFAMVMDDDTLFLDGEGKLTINDVNRVLAENEREMNSFKNVVIGDGITEIGTGVLCHSVVEKNASLQTLWLGANVAVIDNGSITWCTALQYVYLPGSVQRLGKDFLAGSSDAYVVTDGSRDALPALNNVQAKRVLENVDSCDALKRQREEASTRQFGPRKLKASDGALVKKAVRLESGQAQYGPGVAMNAGSYRVTVSGSGLGEVTEDMLEVRSAKGAIQISRVSIGKKSIRYTIKLKEAQEKMEFCLTNATDGVVKIKSVEVTEDVTIPAAVTRWWDATPA